MAGEPSGSKWIGDGSEGGALDVIAAPVDSAGGDGATIVFASATHGTPFNVRREDGGAADDRYYEVEVSELSEGASLAVGLVAKEGFRPGWRARGCFYNGNVTNGSAGLVIGFGKRIEAGDVVGVRCRRRSDGNGDGVGGRRDVIFYQNGRCLGAGFSLDDEGQAFFPCLHVSGGARATYSAPPPPVAVEREGRGRDGGDDPYGGDWAIERAFEGPELGEVSIPERSAVKVSLEKDDEVPRRGTGARYRISVKVDNSFGTSLAIKGKMEAFDEIEFAGRCRATMKMPRPAFRQMERLVQTGLDGGWRKMIVDEGGRLILSGPTGEVICSRYVETFEPVKSIEEDFKTRIIL